MLAAANPHYGEGAEWEDNCQRTVVAYELQRRGYDVTAMPALADDLNTGFRQMRNPDGYLSVYENADIVECRSTTGAKTGDKVRKKMKEWGDGARAVARLEWSKKRRRAYRLGQEVGRQTRV